MPELNPSPAMLPAMIFLLGILILKGSLHDIFISHLALTLCRSYLNLYCLGRKTVIFSSGHLNLHAKPETGIPYREKNHKN
jgi:hypothetical protein